jgi:hypothetical protein
MIQFKHYLPTTKTWNVPAIILGLPFSPAAIGSNSAVGK